MRRHLLSAAVACSVLLPTVCSAARTPVADSFNAMNVEERSSFLKRTLPRKSFLNLGASGEVGTFARGGALQVAWGLDYGGPNDTRPRGGVGSWSIEGSDLTLEGTSLSDGTYRFDRFVAFAYRRKTVFYECGGYGPYFGVPKAWWRSLENDQLLALGDEAEKACE